MRISIVGTGYVGLVSGVCFAEMGHDVSCVDVDEEKISRLKSGEITIYEPGLKVLFDRNWREKRLHFTTDLAASVSTSDVVFLALPTPPGEDGSADLSYVLGVADQLGSLLRGYTVVVDKSTVPVGTAEKVEARIAASGLRSGIDFDVVSNPEFLREGAAVADFMKPDRVVIGASTERAADVMTALYEPFVRQGNPILVMGRRSAEMTKYAANAMLATKITFMNEVANLCSLADADVDEVRRGIGSDNRIGNAFLYPGLGFGGSCFPKDVRAMRKTAHEFSYEFRILDSVLAVNGNQHARLVNRVVERFGVDLTGIHVGVWGLAFKAHTDDVRESPAHRVIEDLLDAGASVSAFDPEAEVTSRTVLGDRITYAADLYEAAAGADALFVCTEWPQFRRPDWSLLESLLKNKIVFDGRNLFDPREMAAAGYEYFSVGRACVPVEDGCEGISAPELAAAA